MKKFFFIILISLLGSYLHAELRNYKNEDKGYDVYIETESVGQNLEQSDIEDYVHQLFTWSESLGNDTKVLDSLPDVLKWGINEDLSEISVETNTTYISRILFDTNYEDGSFTHGTVLFTITSDNPPKIKVETIITVRVFVDKPEPTNTTETSQNVYEDKNFGYNGQAMAEFIGINLSASELDELNKKAYSFASTNAQVKKIRKFTEEQEWLLYQALKKYDLKKNETYIASIVAFPKSFPATFSPIIAIVTITEISESGDYTYSFIAYESTQLENDTKQESGNVIESRIDGEFSGWNGNTIFKLQNGQIWQQVEYSYKYAYKYCPKVKIINSSNGWVMQVDGIDKTIRVKRLK